MSRLTGHWSLSQSVKGVATQGTTTIIGVHPRQKVSTMSWNKTPLPPQISWV